MSITYPIYGTESALTVTSLQSLASSALWQSASISNSTDQAISVRLFITIATTTTAGSDGSVTVWVAGSTDGGTTFAGGASGAQGTYTIVGNSNEQLRQIDLIPIDATEATARTYTAEIVLGNVPKDYSILIQNNTGAALASSGNSVDKLVEQFETI